ncbi:SAVED domain-containing protein [SCandidatus Aminicenantes bacterium Aminicenantia_JdfR_composite]|jgi:hypothetical protein|nr:SAVED domain-containing protein [SCandidatus Aminicenantes bacterium Aminicenantia_JdfR_composite]MCP2596983.1 SAVED domain-containing protein [Candidatus Aminicenantes bacterium AC-335-G13]MCP2598687.1 SAVED domain-containing protein [Candidatus Aminicenantes bacterium AC-335-L06]MCP2620625.1 SAVED domain-containing protein [Candidatus Aminicenantes bacterium AC-334-E05]
MELISIIIDAILGVIFGEVIEKGKKTILKSKKKSKGTQKYEEKVLREEKFTLRGDLGKDLFSAFTNFMETKDSTQIEKFLKKASSDRDVALLIEISRPIEADFRLQLQRPAEYILSSVREIEPLEFPELAEATNKFIRMINSVPKGPKIHLALSVPSCLAFQIGQFIGLSHYDIELYHFQKGKYIQLPRIRRK